ncbi:membrane protein [Pontibacillus chungwhensis BH030062]|uniref:Membrane protein n=1 Tax=Pontibacillus chungwhensis BH030062 TaxID=1385513 RepID=A0A0A2UU82_9BACI|nr:glycosyltransferase family 39 protein [Pontibacillus chungwhensis]KGP91479.1 membrane protein [Pontibacillus chungwhensis BH030062]
MNTFLSLFQRFSVIVILLVGVLFFSFGFVSNLTMIEDVYSLRDLLLLVVVGIVVLLIGVSILRLPIPNLAFVSILLVSAFIIRLVWVLNVDTALLSDFAKLYNAAVSASNGNFAFSDDAYFSRWVYQIGFVMYESLIISIFGEGTMVLKLINVVLGTATVGLVYLIGKSVFNETAGRIAGAVYAIYLPSIVMTSVLTNQYLATFLIFAGLYLLVERFEISKWSWIGIGVLLALGHIIRPIGPFVLLAVGIYVFVVYLLKGDHKLKAFGKLAGIMGVFFIIQLSVSQAFMASGVTDYPLGNRDPLWKFVLGLNHETDGTYSGSDVEILAPLDGEEREQKQRELIEERLSDPGEVLVLMKDKFQIMWGEEHDSSFFWGLTGIEAPNLKTLLYQINNVMFTLFFVFGVVASVKLLLSKRSEIPMKSLLFVLLVIGYAMIHLIIEVQTRYRFFAMPALIMLQGYGIYLVSERLKQLFKRDVGTRSSSLRETK